MSVGEGKRTRRDQGLLREVNKRIREVDGGFTGDVPVTFLCECGEAVCEATLELAPSRYDALLGEPGLILVAAQHLSALDGHPVVAQQDGAVVVSVT